MKTVQQIMQETGAEANIRNFRYMQENYTYKQKIRHAENVARSYQDKCSEMGLNCHISVGGLDSITLHYFLEACGVHVPCVSCSSLEQKGVQAVHKQIAAEMENTYSARECLGAHMALPQDEIDTITDPDTRAQEQALHDACPPVPRMYFLKPLKPKTKVIEELGWPVLSKEIAGKISLLQNPTPKNATAVQTALTTIQTIFTTAWDGIKAIVETVVTVITTTLQNAWDIVSDGVTTAFEGIQQIFTSIWDAIKTAVLGVVLIICDLVTGDFDALKSDISNILSALSEAISGIWNGIQTFISGVMSAIVSFLQAEWNGLLTIISTVCNAISTAVQAIWNAIKTFLSSTMTAIGNAVTTAWNGFLATISSLCQTISTTVQNIWNGILDFFRALPSTLATLGRTMFQRMADAIKGMAGTVYSAATGCISKAVDFIKALPEKALGWGKDFINGFAKGIANAASAVVDNVRGLADDIRSLLHFSRPDEGPLRDYEKWPVDFIHGYANAMRSAMPYLQKTLDGITAGMAIMVNGPQLAGAGAAPVPITKTINYNQTINVTSPDPVSPAETARATRIATRDLISKIKG